MAEPAKIRINEIDKFGMFADPLDSQSKSPRLVWCDRAGNPRITVYTNTPTDTERWGMITAAMDPAVMCTFLDQAKDIALGPVDKKLRVANYTRIRKEDGSYGDKILASEAWVGKDDQGLVWISLTSGTRPKIKFVFKLSDYHAFTKSNGDPLEVAESSALQAVATFETLKITFQRLAGAFRPPRTGFAPQAKTPATPPASGVGDLDDIPF